MTLDVLHYNYRSLASEVRMNEIEVVLKEVKWDIVGLSEIRREGERIYKKKNGNYFYFFGETVGQKGVGFYIKDRVWNRVIEVKGVSERICIMKLIIDKKKLNLLL